MCLENSSIWVRHLQLFLKQVLLFRNKRARGARSVYAVAISMEDTMIKLWEENTGSKLSDITLVILFWDLAGKAMATKQK